MKQLLFILATIIPMALTGQSELTETKTPTTRNSITAATYLGSGAGIAFDYRRDAYRNRELIIGVQTSYSGNSKLNVGFRKYYKTENKLSIGFGVDASLTKRNVIGDNLLSRTIENTLPRVNYGELRFVTGAYYKIDDRFSLMGELQLRPLIPFIRDRNSGRVLKAGLRYQF